MSWRATGALSFGALLKARPAGVKASISCFPQRPHCLVAKSIMGLKHSRPDFPQDGNTWGVWCILATSQEPYGSKHHPRVARQQCAQVSALLLGFFLGAWVFFVCFFVSVRALQTHLGNQAFLQASPRQAQRDTLRHSSSCIRHIFTRSKPGLQIQMCSYQFLEGEYVWISSKNLSGWCRG